MSHLATLESMAAAALSQHQLHTPDSIRSVINALRQTPFCSEVSDDEAERLARQLEERVGVVMTIGAVVRSEFRPWLEAAKPSIDPYYWTRYRRMLIDDGMPPQVVAKMDEVTDRVLSLLHDPREDGQWDRRGMVVGHVQSGKTANYIGLLSKAADAGYKVIIVIAGIHNNLRNQTQVRIDQGFVGRDSARLLAQKDERWIGVGRFDRTRRPVTFTNSLRDFNRATATAVGIPLHNLNEPAVFVIKKNHATLTNLLEWLREHSAVAGRDRVTMPMLLIDDEADNASINIRHGKGEVARINGLVRQLLQTFERSCYIGYTATPFANIFIDPDTDDEMVGADLFPRHFIVSLDPPSDYLGPVDVFLQDPQRYIRHTEVDQAQLPSDHKIDHVVSALPASLIRALNAFVVTRAIRLKRGASSAHTSMLVNASRFTSVQAQLRNALHNELADIQASARVNAGLPVRDALQDHRLSALHSVWQDEYASCGVDWRDVQKLLHEAAAPIKVVEVNSNSTGTLNYADHKQSGLHVIAVGGYSLSRGLTLEGLVVSYYLRNSMMYDTLMQMGRWFGYRHGYRDLCRIWMPEEAEGWYAHIADSIELLRAELRTMEAANATPEQFGLKVRSHPDALLVTARNKMGSGERLVVSVGLANSFVETTIVVRDEGVQERNRAAAARLVQQIVSEPGSASQPAKVAGGWLYSGVEVGAVLRFLSEYRNHDAATLTQPRPIRLYIQKRSPSELASWDVLFASVDPGRSSREPLHLDQLVIDCQRRSAGARTKGAALHISNRQRVASRGVERRGVPEALALQAEQDYRDRLIQQGRATPLSAINYPDHIYRAVRPRPLLIVHCLYVDGTPDKRDPERPVVAWSASFPRTALEEDRVEYVVNTTWLREAYGAELEEEEMNGDE